LPRSKRKRSLGLGKTVAAIALVVVAGAVLLFARDNGSIYPNVYIAGVKVGGLAGRTIRSRAWVERLRRVVPVPHASVVVRAADASHRCKLEQVGVSFDLAGAVDRAYAVGRTGPPLERLLDRVASCLHRSDIAVPAVIDRKAAATFISNRARQFNRPPQNASIEVEGARVHITPGRPGLAVQTEKALAAIERWAGGGCRGDLQMPVDVTGPAVTADQLKDVDTVLASVSTTLAGSSRNRRHNIALAAGAVNGYALAPGAVFSYNRVVGPRTEETGYRTAPVIRGGKLVPGTGGGACQLSSTLYQVALRAELEIVARSHHSHPVAYTPAGLDATVVYPVIDLKFRNGLSHPVVLRAGVKGNRLQCQALGHGPAPQIAILRQVQWVKPPQPQVVRDESLPAGQRVVELKPRRGMRVRVLRRGAQASDHPAQLVATNYYAPQRGVIREGGAPALPPLTVPAASPGPPMAPEVGLSRPDAAGSAGADRAPSPAGDAPGRAPGHGKNAARQG